MTPDPRQALAFWPEAFRAASREAIHAVGFSGAQLWRLRTPFGAFCLRASPPGANAALALPRFAWMRAARAAGLTFVPAVLPTLSGSPFSDSMGRLWELQEWMPGAPVWDTSLQQLEAACEALARLHLAWEAGSVRGRVPAIARRLATLAEPGPGWLLRHVPGLRAGLEQWGEPRALQPCLCDVWPGNVLFVDSEVAGIVDYADMRMDAPAADVARLLGEMAQDDEGRWSRGLASYRRVRAMEPEEEELARLLDRAGTLAAALRWERRLNEGLTESARSRAERVLGRVGRW